MNELSACHIILPLVCVVKPCIDILRYIQHNISESMSDAVMQGEKKVKVFKKVLSELSAFK
jgi:hypothetical protein